MPPGRAELYTPQAPVSTTRTRGELKPPGLEPAGAKAASTQCRMGTCRVPWQASWVFCAMGRVPGGTAKRYWMGYLLCCLDTIISSFFLHTPEHLTNRQMPKGPRRSRPPCCWRVSPLAPETSQRKGTQMESWSWALPLKGLPAICPELLLRSQSLEG